MRRPSRIPVDETKLCDAVDPQYRSACTTARDQAAFTL